MDFFNVQLSVIESDKIGFGGGDGQFKDNSFYGGGYDIIYGIFFVVPKVMEEGQVELRRIDGVFAGDASGDAEGQNGGFVGAGFSAVGRLIGVEGSGDDGNGRSYAGVALIAFDTLRACVALIALGALRSGGDTEFDKGGSRRT